MAADSPTASNSEGIDYRFLFVPRKPSSTASLHLDFHSRPPLSTLENEKMKNTRPHVQYDAIVSDRLSLSNVQNPIDSSRPDSKRKRVLLSVCFGHEGKLKACFIECRGKTDGERAGRSG